MWPFTKKKKNTVVNEMFQDFNDDVLKDLFNEVKKGKDMKRVVKENAQRRKEVIIENLNELKRRMYGVRYFDGFIDEIRETISKISKLEDNTNTLAMEIVDRCIVLAINECKNYCNRESVAGAIACISNINELVNERFHNQEYFLNPEYVKTLLAYQEAYVSYQDRVAMRNASYQKGVKACEQYNDPSYKGDKRSLIELKNLAQDEVDNYDGEIDELNVILENYRSALSTLRKHTDNHNKNSERYHTSMEKTLEMNYENEYDSKTNQKYNEELRKSKAKAKVRNTRIDENLINKNKDEEESLPQTISMK